MTKPVLISTKQLQDLVLECAGVISYNSLKDELDPSVICDLSGKAVVNLPQEANSDPFAWADLCQEKLLDKKVVVFIPGQKFDPFGNRHGRGGGWYDRFLSCIPDEWITVGMCRTSQFSETKLGTNPWDVEVNHVLVADAS